MKRYQLLTLVLISLFIISCQNNGATKKNVTTKKNGFDFSSPKKSPHYESNTPDHASILAAVPVNVVINFNFDLDDLSTISIKKNGQEYESGKTVVDDNNLSMRRAMPPDAPDGLYDVEYRAYWPDKSSHDGHFQFAIKKGNKSSFQDMTQNKNVNIELVNTSIKPKNILIAKGAKVTWVNKDDVEHFVNTDTHPAHTYYPEQNSRGLNKGQTFSLTFNKVGIYPYHCSAHASQMTGNIIVE